MAKLRGLCSKLSILSCCVILLFSNAYAQKENNEQRKKNINKNNVQIDPTLISSEKVPANVIKTFNKRFSSATEAQWHNNGEKDTFYIVNYIMREVQMESLFGKSGYWISTTEPVDPDNLLSACHKTIAMFFSKYKIVAAYKISRSDKNNQFLVHIIESQNAKSQSITKIYLDKSGKLINIEEPTEVQENKTEKIDKKTAKEEAKLKKEFEKDTQLDIYPTKISDDELPNGIQYWVNKNYPDYIFKNIEYLIDEDLKKKETSIELLFKEMASINLMQQYGLLVMESFYNLLMNSVIRKSKTKNPLQNVKLEKISKKHFPQNILTFPLLFGRKTMTAIG